MNKKPNIFVIVVTYKGMQWYDRCFGSLRESIIPIKTIVVDNSPTDEDSTYIKAHFPEVHLIKTDENLGFGRANNLGMRYALDNGCDYVFLLNQDAWLDTPDTFSKLVAVAEAHHEYGIISPMHLKADKSHMNISMDDGANNYQLLSDLYIGHPSDVYPYRYVNAAAWLISRATIQIVGGFDPIYFHYAEDDNYMQRVLFHGLKIGVCPSAYIIHDHKDSELSDISLTYRQKQLLLLEWTNLNDPYTVHKYLKHYLRKWMASVLSGKMNEAASYIFKAKYCIKMRSAVEHSRAENIQKKPSWI